MIKLGIPVLEQHSLTHKCLGHLSENCVIPESVEVVVFDNASKSSYYDCRFAETNFRFKTRLVRFEQNYGYYRPLLQVVGGTTDADIIGLMHNDLFIYEKGWDRRLLDSFLYDPRLGMVGVCGSDEIDDRGGRGGGTMCNFAGRVGQLQEHTGKKIAGLHPALILDSMFMACRRPLIDALDIDEHTTLCHFMDKLWPLKIMTEGWRVAVLGLSVDHIGGQTAVLEGERFEEDAADWCRQEGISFKEGQASLALYLESERRFLDYGRSKGYVPSRIH